MQEIKISTNNFTVLFPTFTCNLFSLPVVFVVESCYFIQHAIIVLVVSG